MQLTAPELLLQLFQAVNRPLSAYLHLGRFHWFSCFHSQQTNIDLLYMHRTLLNKVNLQKVNNPADLFWQRKCKDVTHRCYRNTAYIVSNEELKRLTLRAVFSPSSHINITKMVNYFAELIWKHSMETFMF